MKLRIALSAAALAAGAVTAVAAPASAAPARVPAATPSTVRPADSTFCKYQVNATGVRVRSAPSTSSTAIGEVSYPTTGYASQTTYSGSGLTWRSAFGGYVAAQYLTRVAGTCIQ